MPVTNNYTYTRPKQTIGVCGLLLLFGCKLQRARNMRGFLVVALSLLTTLLESNVVYSQLDEPDVESTITSTVDENIIVEIEIIVDGDCPNPCPWKFTGLITVPGTSCKNYVQCQNGKPIGELECFGKYIFVEEKGGCDIINDAADYCQPVSCPLPPTLPPTTSPTITAKPVTESPTIYPTPKPPPTPRPTPVLFSFMSLIEAKRDLIEATVLQSASGPRTAYTLEGLMGALSIATNQFPSDKTFYVGDYNGESSGLEYGIVNFSALLSQAMSEGIRMDSCDEWNIDYVPAADGGEIFPLSNSCGQFKRAYDTELCLSTEPFECPVDTNMEITAIDINPNPPPGKTGPPPFSCRPHDGVTFPGYYNSFKDIIVQEAYSNSLGRTDLEGCCWWKRGALMTGGRCAIGKLNKYVGKEAADSRGVYVYPNIDFCTDPGAICNDIRTHELRWLIAFVDWSRVETYVDPNTGWSYMEELKKFVDNGLVGDDFIDAVSNIVTKKCHNPNLCADTWGIDPAREYYELKRRNDFRNIISSVFNLPLTPPPTPSPTTLSPTLSPTVYTPPTPRPTRKRKPVVALSPNSSIKCMPNNTLLVSIITLVTTWYALI